MWLGVYIAVVIINSIIETYIGENMNAIVANKINRRIYTQVLKTDYKYFERTDFYNDYTWTLNNFYSQTFSSVQMVWQLLMSLFTIGTIGTLMLSLDWVVLVLVVLSVIMNVIINNVLTKEAFEKRQESLLAQRMLSYIQRVFYIKDYAMGVKTTGIKNTLLKKYDESTSALSNVIKRHRGKVTVLSILLGVMIYTIAKLILHLYNPESRDIYVNGNNISTYNVTDLRNHIGVAFQDSMLYAFNIRENICVYNDEISNGELDVILKKIGVSNVLEKNKANNDAVLTRELDDNGIELSGGESHSQKKSFEEVILRMALNRLFLRWAALCF